MSRVYLDIIDEIDIGRSRGLSCTENEEPHVEMRLNDRISDPRLLEQSRLTSDG